MNLAFLQYLHFYYNIYKVILLCNTLLEVRLAVDKFLVASVRKFLSILRIGQTLRSQTTVVQTCAEKWN